MIMAEPGTFNHGPSDHDDCLPSIRENQELLNASRSSRYSTFNESEISDVDQSGEYSLTGILSRCKQQVLKPYWCLLIFIGWRPFARDRVLHQWYYRYWNIFYPFLITFLLLFSYTYDILVFQQNLSPRNDLHPGLPKKELWYHMFSESIVPNCLHFLSFVYGFWYIRIQENEEIYALIEQVFLQANPIQRGNVTQAAIIKSLRFILVCGALWTLATVGINGISFVLNVEKSIPLTVFLMVINLVGKTIQHLINTAVVVNFTIQCEVIIYYMRIIGTRMQEKSSELKTIMNDILKVKQSISRLNGPTANMTSLCIFYFALRFIIGLCLMISNQYRTTAVWTYWSIVWPIWFLIMFFSLCQAARVNATCEMYKQGGHDAKVFGYLSSTQVELDSFLLFITSAKLKVKLLYMPIQRGYICGIFIVGLFTLAILILTNVIKYK